MWWRRALDTSPGAWNGPDVVQLLKLLEVNYRKGRPPPAALP
jgi:hypothetical protein